MSFKDMSRWNIRASAVYALGIWTMIGSYAYMTYSGRYEVKPVKKVEEVQEPDDQFVYETAHSKTTIVYKKDFVPYTTRIYNLIRSFSSDPGTGDSDK